MKLKLSLLLLGFLLFSCGEKPNPKIAVSLLINEAWEFKLQEYPLFATSVGRGEYNALLPDMSKEAHKRRLKTLQSILDRLNKFDPNELSVQSRINRALALHELKNEIARIKYKAFLIPFNADSGFHSDYASLPSQMPFQARHDFDNYIERMRKGPAYFRQQIELLKLGIQDGYTLPRIVMNGFDISTKSHIVNHWEKSVFYAPFQKRSEKIAPDQWQALLKAGQNAIMDSVVAAYQLLDNFLLNEYIPNARTTTGASDLPNGKEFYESQVQYFTTLDITPDEAHQIGLTEVARIKNKMEAIIKLTGFNGNFKAFLKFLRTDKRFYAKTPEQLLKEAAYICKKMDGKLPSLFKTLPRLPYAVAPVPDHIAPKYTSGRYIGARYGGIDPGYYWVNTYALDKRPLYTLEALSFHEAVPGHHLQIALAQEMQNLPAIRRFTYLSAFGEGWALYAEKLGLEAGFYTDPYSNFGRLTYEMWRACRLVVDTGLHSKGWSRKQAMDYLAANTALPLHEVRTETDRYISWPGQALSYKIGELKIQELRKKAEKQLGGAFDIRTFHEAILRNGSIPLSTLEQEIDNYIKRASKIEKAK